MKIEMVGPDKLRVVLTVTDLSAYQLDYTSIRSDDPATRRMVDDILERARDEQGFRLKNNRLLVEVVPGKNSGCVLYLTKGAGRAPALEPPGESLPPRAPGAYILRCAGLDDMIAAIGCFGSYPDVPLRSSALFRDESGYRLLFRPMAAGLPRRRFQTLLLELAEFGKAAPATDLEEAILREHAQPIAGQHAVERFLRYFG